ncbi:MAG TPA: hypothetical protein VNO13_06025 [Candidatus Udaeobacter sp.]|nr:hypothetical protein [Candidatus Udaeobacter sp.]
MYDRILRDLRSAIAAIGVGQIESRVNSLNHALTIIGELQECWISSAAAKQREI